MYFCWFVPIVWDLHQLKHPGRLWQPPVRQNTSSFTIRVWTMLDLSLWKWKISYIFFPLSIFHFPFPIFPLVRQKLYYPQTSPSKDQRMSNIWQLPSIKPTPATKRDHHSHHLHYIHRYIIGTCIRADIYYGQCICIRAIYYRHMYTCGYIFLMLLRLAVHICIRAKILRAYVYVRRYIYIYIMAYHLLLDSTKPYSGKPPHRASHGQA